MTHKTFTVLSTPSLFVLVVVLIVSLVVSMIRGPLMMVLTLFIMVMMFIVVIMRMFPMMVVIPRMGKLVMSSSAKVPREKVSQ